MCRRRSRGGPTHRVRHRRVFGTGERTNLARLMRTTLTRLGDAVIERTPSMTLASVSRSPLPMRESLERLSPSFLRYCETAPHGLRPAAAAAVVAADGLVHDRAVVLPVTDGAAPSRLYGFVEGTKTAPWPVPMGRRVPR